MTNAIARQKLPVPVATLDTGTLHAQTRALIPRIRARYGIEVRVLRPREEAVVHFATTHGERAIFDSVRLRKACCAMRKLEPMQRLLAGHSAWITGLRRAQSEARAAVPFSEIDADGREKFYPLADWSEADVWHYISVHDVPYNELHDQSFPSIGCEPCTRAVSIGEDPRAGRWWWEQGEVKECGLHLRPAEPALNA